MTRNRWGETDIPDQAGRVALVTGPTSGIGYETARALATRGAWVILAGRSSDRLATAEQGITRKVPGARLSTVVCDVADLASVAAAAEELKVGHPAIDLLILNAGVMAPPRQVTVDGFELQFATNHLGHFALGAQILPLVNNEPGARVVAVSSLAHREGQIDFDDLTAERGYDAFARYRMTKLANLLFTFELQRRLKGAGSNVAAFAAHPGVTATDLGRSLGSPAARVFQPLVLRMLQGAAAGALPTLRAATDPDLEPGSYIGPARWGETRGHPVVVDPAAPALDHEVAGRLWAASEELTGVAWPL
ncbi:MAG: SDR family NAD(P)-dependent oxidoreductase [Actinomycetia bacterium]|nr:SDR family NAD(P)-dependent oxidoreductase [Actinomycetes bacterium]MCP3913374.1 SDR family NAD(P)-dependent oxidoreductase [Actinomycetes bacterium]MCP4084501.1 SDR family NAD(P)-dependent oxidoreductase [Actinomycetes bacterium]